MDIYLCEALRLFSNLSLARRYLKLYLRARAASQYAATQGLPGLNFGRFGTSVGRKLLARGSRIGLDYLLTPVNCVRYFEFDFALASLLNPLGCCLDVGSPRLFSLYVARYHPSASILMINPDSADLQETSVIAFQLGLQNVHVQQTDVASLVDRPTRYQCIWSISVIEHICGEYDDGLAMRTMYDSLAPGGRLILTFPVDRRFSNEYRDHSYYGLSTPQHHGKFFFQRFYDGRTIQERLLSPIGRQPTKLRWYGEKEPGRFAEYERRWTKLGSECTVDDPREMADGFQEFQSWEDMPGLGVCCLAIDKDALGLTQHQSEARD